LFDFIANELERLEPKDARRIRPLRVALRNQRDDLLAFAGVLLTEIRPSTAGRFPAPVCYPKMAKDEPGHRENVQGPVADC
jgi:hypothetical protein